MTITFLLIFVIGGYAAFLFYVAQYYWRRFMNSGQAARTFTYHISDIWAATLALTPTFIVIAMAASESGATTNKHFSRHAAGWVALVVTMLSGQLMGIYIGRVWGQLPGWQGNNKTLTSATLIVAAGIMGLLLPLIYYLLLCGILVCISIVFMLLSVLFQVPVVGSIVAGTIPVIWLVRRHRPPAL